MIKIFCRPDVLLDIKPSVAALKKRAGSSCEYYSHIHLRLFPSEPELAGNPWFLPTPVSKKLPGQVVQVFYRPDALPVTQQKCQGTEGKAKL